MKVIRDRHQRSKDKTKFILCITIMAPLATSSKTILKKWGTAFPFPDKQLQQLPDLRHNLVFHSWFSISHRLASACSILDICCPFPDSIYLMYMKRFTAVPKYPPASRPICMLFYVSGLSRQRMGRISPGPKRHWPAPVCTVEIERKEIHSLQSKTG
jgi:hypothetical protein